MVQCFVNDVTVNLDFLSENSNTSDFFCAQKRGKNPHSYEDCKCLDSDWSGQTRGSGTQCESKLRGRTKSSSLWFRKTLYFVKTSTHGEITQMVLKIFYCQYRKYLKNKRRYICVLVKAEDWQVSCPIHKHIDYHTANHSQQK